MGIKDFFSKKETSPAVLSSDSSEETYKIIFENASDGILLADVKTKKFVMANSAICGITSYSKEELLDLSVDKIHPEKDLPYVNDQFTKQIEGKITLAKDIPVLRKDKKITYCDVNSKSIRIGEKELLVGFFRDVTERRKILEDLKASENRLQRVFETMAEGVVLIAPDGQIVQVNSAAERILGISRSEIESRNYISPEWEILRPDGTSMPPEEMAGPRAMKEKRSVKDVVMGVRRPDGSVTWINVCAAPLINKGGEFGGVVGTFADITERRKAEEVLKESEDRLRIIFEDAPDAYYLNNLKGEFVDGNKAAEELTGYKREELIGKNFLKLNILPPAELPKVLADLAKNALGQPTGPADYTLNRKDGKQIVVEIRTYPVKIKGQTLTLGIVRDVTQRKKAEEEIRKGDEKWLSLIENTNDIIMVVDADGIIQYINKTIPPYTRDESTGKKVYDYIPEEQRDIMKESLEKVFKTGAQDSYEVSSNIPKIGAVWFSTKVVPIKHDDKVTGAIMISTDITERRKVEGALLESQQKYIDLFENANDSIYTMDLTGKFPSFNHAAASMLGYSEEEFGRLNMKDVLTPESYAIAAQMVQKAVVERSDLKELQPWKFRMLKKDGAIIDTEVRTRLIWEKGQIIGIQGITRDVTERKKAEEELRKRTEELEKINRVAVGRELKMVELKKKIEQLEAELKKDGASNR